MFYRWILKTNVYHSCTIEVTMGEYVTRLLRSLQLNTVIDGEFDNSQRADFQEQVHFYIHTDMKKMRLLYILN